MKQYKKLMDPMGEAFTKFLEDNGAKVIDCTPKKNVKTDGISDGQREIVKKLWKRMAGKSLLQQISDETQVPVETIEKIIENER